MVRGHGSRPHFHQQSNNAHAAGLVRRERCKICNANLRELLEQQFHVLFDKDLALLRARPRAQKLGSAPLTICGTLKNETRTNGND
jgi:hypothetical protein